MNTGAGPGAHLGTPAAVGELAGPGSHIRRAGRADFEAVARLFGELHRGNAELDDRFALGDGWREILSNHFLRTHDQPGALWVLAWDRDEPVGLLIVEAHHDSELFRHRSWAELVALYVSSGHRGGGLAAGLMARAQAWAASRGFDRLQLYVTADNERARRFYSRSGLTPVQEVWRIALAPVPEEAPSTPIPLLGQNWTDRTLRRTKPAAPAPH
jgi:GNAT superfamily N-acetyltransferase